MRHLIIENNVVVNVVQATADYAQGKGWEPAEDGVDIGWARTGLGKPWAAGTLPTANTVPEQILRWQAVRALRLHEDPSAPGTSCLDVVHAIASGIEDDNLRADVDDALQSVIYWRRNSPTLEMMARGAGWSEEFVDQLFIAAQEFDL